MRNPQRVNGERFGAPGIRVANCTSGLTTRPPSAGVNISGPLNSESAPPDSREEAVVCTAGVSVAPSLAHRIREARFDDYEKIAALQLRNGLVPRSYARWSALWDGNPARCRLSPIGWVIDIGAGEIGGYVGNLPLLYRFKGSEIRAATPYSWATDAAFRGYSLALLDRVVRQPGVDLIVCTTPNPPASRAFGAFQFKKAPGDWEKSCFWITGYRGFARSALRAGNISLGSVFANPVAGVLYARDALRGPDRVTHHQPFEILCQFDARFDRFGEELAGEQRGRLFGVRDRATLEWHFGAALAAGNAWILAASDRGKLVACAILDRRDYSALELKRIRFVDFHALDGWGHLFQPALACALDICRAERAHVLENTGCWLERWGAKAPYRRAMKTWGFYYKARHEGLAKELEDPAVWAPSAFDGDASL